MLPTTLQAPQALEEPYSQVRLRQLKTKEQNPFAMMFLLWMYEQFMEDVFASLNKKDRQRVDCLLMLKTLIDRADHKEMTGMDVEHLTDVLAQVSHLMKWE